MYESRFWFVNHFKSISTKWMNGGVDLPPPVSFMSSFHEMGNSLLLPLLTLTPLSLSFSLCRFVSDIGRFLFLLKHAKKEKVNTTKKNSFPFTLICFRVAQTMVKVHPWTQNRKLSTHTLTVTHRYVTSVRVWEREENEKCVSMRKKWEWAIDTLDNDHNARNYTYANRKKNTQTYTKQPWKTQTLEFGFDPYSKKMVFYCWYLLDIHTHALGHGYRYRYRYRLRGKGKACMFMFACCVWCVVFVIG